MPRSPSFLCALFPKFLRPLLPFLFLCFWFLFFPQALAQDSLKPCQEIRLADVGWTDITATTAITAELLKQKGYVPKVHILSVPVTFKGLQTGDVDVFLGNWMPTQAADIAPYLQEGSVQKVNTNLQGAQFTFAVPHYVASAGIRSIEEVHAHKERFKGTIYGLEPGNDGNRIVLELIQNNIYNLQGWNLVESSEQGMLIQVQRAIAQKEWILFLGWQPHPMNSAIEIAYLKDPLEKWGPGGGTAEVHTIVSQKFAQNCPALLVFFKELRFTLAQENEWMRRILEESQEPEKMAKTWLAENPEQTAQWLASLAPCEVPLSPRQKKKDLEVPFPFLGGLPKIPLGDWMEKAVKSLSAQFSQNSQKISHGLSAFIGGMIALLSWFHPLFLILIFALIAYIRNRSVLRALAIALSFILIWNLGYWEATLQTLALVFSATVFSVGIGVPLGIWGARHPLFYRGLRLILDFMQTIPSFVYLIPTLMLFGLGVVPGLVSTIIFALPAPIRLTHLGIISVPKELREASTSFGAHPLQTLWKVEIPYALPSLMEGVTQAIMLSLSMVVIAALVGAEGLGTDVVRALNTVNISKGFDSGLSIVIVAVCFDRMLKKKNPFPSEKKE